MATTEKTKTQSTSTTPPETYTSLKTESVTGFAGDPSCNHEFVKTITNSQVDGDGINTQLIKTQTTALQCLKCGKQTSMSNIWTTYIKTDDNTTTDETTPPTE